jgi:hypothetical protein
MSSNNKYRVLSIDDEKLFPDFGYSRKTLNIINAGNMGKGIEGDPIRNTYQIFDDEGNLLLWLDPFNPQDKPVEDLVK